MTSKSGSLEATHEEMKGGSFLCRVLHMSLKKEYQISLYADMNQNEVSMSVTDLFFSLT